jgi:hypothetical protein
MKCIKGDTQHVIVSHQGDASSRQIPAPDGHTAQQHVLCVRTPVAPARRRGASEQLLHATRING